MCLMLGFGVCDGKRQEKKGNTKKLFNNSNALRGSLPKSVPLDFGLDKTFALYFYHEHYYPSL